MWCVEPARIARSSWATGDAVVLPEDLPRRRLEQRHLLGALDPHDLARRRLVHPRRRLAQVQHEHRLLRPDREPLPGQAVEQVRGPVVAVDLPLEIRPQGLVVRHLLRDHGVRRLLR